MDALNAARAAAEPEWSAADAAYENARAEPKTTHEAFGETWMAFQKAAFALISAAVDEQEAYRAVTLCQEIFMSGLPIRAAAINDG